VSSNIIITSVDLLVQVVLKTVVELCQPSWRIRLFWRLIISFTKS